MQLISSPYKNNIPLRRIVLKINCMIAMRSRKHAVRLEFSFGNYEDRTLVCTRVSGAGMRLLKSGNWVGLGMDFEDAYHCSIERASSRLSTIFVTKAQKSKKIKVEVGRPFVSLKCGFHSCLNQLRQ